MTTQIPTDWIQNKVPSIDILGNRTEYDVSAVTMALQRHQAFLHKQFFRYKLYPDRLRIAQEIRDAYEETIWATGVSRGTIPTHWH